MFTKANAKILLFIIGFVFSIFMFSGVVSAATLNATEAELAASGVKNYTEVTTDIPGYVVVNNKNSSSPSFLKTVSTWTIQLNSGTTTPVTISSVNAPTGPSGSATGTLSKSEYLTVATNVKNFIASNGRAPNYASSSLGNIRYESLVYTYSKILDFYRTNDRLPNSVSVVNVVGVSGGVMIDSTPPTVTANPDGGVYTANLVVTLTATDNRDPHPSIYYTTDGTTPTTSSALYTNPIGIYLPGSTVLKFMARDASGNQATVQTMTYTLKLVKDVTTGKTYTSIQSAINDSTTTNGDVIQINNGIFTENIVINKRLTIKGLYGGNVLIQPLNSSNPIITINSNGSGSTLQLLTLQGSTNSNGIYINNANNCSIITNIFMNNNNGIYVTYSNNTTLTNNIATNNNDNGVYIEYSNNNTISGNDIHSNGESGLYPYYCENNNIINNDITDNGRADIFLYFSNNNIVQNNILTNSEQNSGINLATAHNNIITGNDLSNNGDCGIGSWNSNYNTITNNTVSNNTNYGFYFYNSNNNTFENNTLTNATNSGICLTNSSNNNTIKENTIKNNGYSGITCYISENANIVGNVISNNPHGIYINNATASISFNRIYDNNVHGLSIYNNGTVVAVNNWWGTNNPTISSTNGSDIYVSSGTATYKPWLTLKVTTSPTGTNGHYIVTADLTHNSSGSDTSPLGNIPDNIPINFTTTFGTIGITAYTNKGKAVSTLNCTTHGKANITASLDTQNTSTSIIYGVYDQATQTTYGSIQEAINDPATSPGDTILIDGGTYNENIIISKKINLIAGNGATPSIIGSITINSGGDGSVIQDITIHGNINLNANNCTIIDNIIIGNGTSGIIASNSINNKITYNNITSNGFNGIQSNFSSNNIIYNTIHGCITGIYSENSNNTIIGNNIINNYNGICTYNSTDTIHFNRITENTYGLKNEIGTINATNNWWGSNFPVVSSSSLSDIYIVSGMVIYNPCLILRVNVSSTNSGGNTSVTADLTHNSQGEDTSSQGHIPDGIPVNFTTNIGTIINSAYTFKGKAATILNLGSTQNATVTAGASVDHQSASTTGLIATGTAVLNITSTAIDNSTGQPLNITYNIPLNSSVTWLSVIWIPTTIPGISALADELQVVLNGNVVLNRFLYNNNTLGRDTLTFNLAYPGVSGLNLTVNDPQDYHVINLNFPGNVINRTSQVIYNNATPYEGMKTFAIATTDVTDAVLQYWLDQYSLYQSVGAMDAAYATFLTALLTVYVHDDLADNIASDLNVTWTRTSPVVVSVGDEPYQTYLTLESDHSMGMTVVGAPENVWIFNYVTSSAISPIEYAIFSECTGNLYQSYSLNGEYGSVVLDLLYKYYMNSTSVEVFVQNGYIIEKSVGFDDNFIVIDPETGIMRDINIINGFCGVTVPYVNYITMINTGSWVNSFFPDTPVSLFGNPFGLGSATFFWNGLGRVVIASGYDAALGTFPIWADGELTATSSLGSVSFNEANPENTKVYGNDGLDITSILIPNATNQINLTITASGDYYGWSRLNLYQTNIKNEGYHGFNATNVVNNIGSGFGGGGGTYYDPHEEYLHELGEAYRQSHGTKWPGVYQDSDEKTRVAEGIREMITVLVHFLM